MMGSFMSSARCPEDEACATLGKRWQLEASFYLVKT